MSRIPSQDATRDQANVPTRGVEAKHPTQYNDEANDTKWPNRTRKNEEKAPVTQRKRHMMPKFQQQHLYARDVEEGRSQQISTSSRLCAKQKVQRNSNY